MQQIWHYLDPNGCGHFVEWRDQVRDMKVCIAIDRRVMRLELGNFGDYKPLHEGVQELCIDVSADYRTYYAKAGVTIVLLSCSGDKWRQSADIDRTCTYWRDWQNRTGD